MTRTDANELVSRLVSRGRSYSDDLLKELERLLDQARRGVEPARQRATRVASEATRRAREAADPALAHAERLKRRARGSKSGAAKQSAKPTAGGTKPAAAKPTAKGAAKPASGSSPIANYESLNATQVRARLKNLSKADLRKVRSLEEKGKARKTVLAEIDRRLAG